MSGSTFLRPGIALLYSWITPQILGLTPYGSTFLIFAPKHFWYAYPETRPGALPKNVFENIGIHISTFDKSSIYRT